MAYYLSKLNRLIILSLVDRLKEATEDVIIESPNPNDLASVIRSAGSTSEFEWIKHKFSIRLREKGVLLKFRLSSNRLSISSDRLDTTEGVQKVIEEKDFFGIVQYLITNSPDRISFKSNLDESELIRLHLYCSKNNYTLTTKEDNEITFTKTIE